MDLTDWFKFIIDFSIFFVRYWKEKKEDKNKNLADDW